MSRSPRLYPKPTRPSRLPGVPVARCPGVVIRWVETPAQLLFMPSFAWRKARGDETLRDNDVYTIEGDLAGDTAVAIAAIHRKDGPAGLSAWLQSVWSESVTEPATGAYQADAGGWYRSNGRMVQRASYSA
jgi:hypothetical protein